MRALLIPALTFLLGYPAFAHDEPQPWKYRTHQRPEIHQESEAYGRRGWKNPGYGHRRHARPGYYQREVVVVHPEPRIVHVRPMPLPPPPPVGIHLWFGF